MDGVDLSFNATTGGLISTVQHVINGTRAHSLPPFPMTPVTAAHHQTRRRPRRRKRAARFKTWFRPTSNGTQRLYEHELNSRVLTGGTTVVESVHGTSSWAAGGMLTVWNSGRPDGRHFLLRHRAPSQQHRESSQGSTGLRAMATDGNGAGGCSLPGSEPEQWVPTASVRGGCGGGHGNGTASRREGDLAGKKAASEIQGGERTRRVFTAMVPTVLIPGTESDFFWGISQRSAPYVLASSGGDKPIACPSSDGPGDSWKVDDWATYPVQWPHASIRRDNPDRLDPQIGDQGNRCVCGTRLACGARMSAHLHAASTRVGWLGRGWGDWKGPARWEYGPSVVSLSFSLFFYNFIFCFLSLLIL